MIENERLVKARKKNMKLFAFYRTLARDALFLYAIKLLFLTQIKKIPASDVIFSISIYALSMVILQIPATIVIQKIGYRKSAFLSNLFNIFYVLILMFSTNVIHLCIAEFTSALTFSLKDVAEPSLLNISIPKTEKKGKIFSKIEGKGQAGYYFIEAITAALSGFIYAVNPYLPLILCIIISTFACMISLLFEEIEDKETSETKNEMQEVKQYVQDIKMSFAFIFKSKRLKSLMLYNGFTWGFMCVMSEYRETLLKDIGASSQIMGIMAAIFGIVSAYSSKKQLQFHNRFRNNSLSIIIVSCSISMILSGAIVVVGTPIWLCIVTILILGIIRESDTAMSLILVNRYLGNFANQQIISKIYAANSIVKNLIRMIITMLASALLGATTSANSMILGGIIFFIIGIIIILYMKPRVGLKPEEYPKQEIEMKV